ncbi:MAG: hypothetical protein HON04_02765 [Planctomicrobium sp.]|jgi:hypothetical protein|nr:hypothetical protein [Planctomicrobium sp.]
MLTPFANHFYRNLIVLCLALTCGCATVSERPTMVSHPPLDPEIPIQALLSEPMGSIAAISQTPKNIAPEKTVTSPATSSPPLLPVPPHVTSQKNIQAVEKPKSENRSSEVKSTQPVALTTHQVNCLPELKQWKAEFAKKSEQTDKKLNEMQASLNASQEKIARMETNQAHSKTEIERLKNQVDFYRREVIRLEQLMETQHASDLVILDSLTNQLGGLLDRTKRSNAY